ncbi:anaphase-promoting complex, cyclosome, subunit 3-domain-containing protein, partial [Endogone sp. FLAS-F59071]
MVTTTDPPLFAYTLRALIWHSLDNHLHRNAIFLAERLLATDSTDEDSIHLLALCHYLDCQTTAAYTILKGAGSVKCRYLFARCCLQLDRPQEGEMALTLALSEKRNQPARNDEHGEADRAEKKTVFGLDSITIRNDTPDEASILCLLGLLCKKASRINQALDYFHKCLKLNPFMWTAFEGLCQLGFDVQHETLLHSLTDDALPPVWPRRFEQQLPAPKGKARMTTDVGYRFFASRTGMATVGGVGGENVMVEDDIFGSVGASTLEGVAEGGRGPNSFLAKLQGVLPSPIPAVTNPKSIIDTNFDMNILDPSAPPQPTTTPRRGGTRMLQAASPSSITTTITNITSTNANANANTNTGIVVPSIPPSLSDTAVPQPPPANGPTSLERARQSNHEGEAGQNANAGGKSGRGKGRGRGNNGVLLKRRNLSTSASMTRAEGRGRSTNTGTETG